MHEKKEKFNSITHIIKFITGILSWVVLVILVLIAAFLLYYFVSMKVYSQRGEKFRPVMSLYVILTESMVPNINPKDVIIDVTITNPDDIHVGDVITFVSSASLTKGMTITHRVIDIKDDPDTGERLYYTQGDANLSPDGAPAKFTNVLGKVLFRVPKLGFLQHFLATKGGWLVIVVIPALIIIIGDILKIFRLQLAKTQVESHLSQEGVARQKEQEEKALIEEKLNERYRRKLKEPDPIPKKHYVTISNGINNTHSRIELPQFDELPKLKPHETTLEKEEKSNEFLEKKDYTPRKKKKKRKNKR